MLSKNAKWPKRSKRKRVSALLCSILLVSAIAGAAVVAPVPVFALSAGGIQGTIASIILSLLLQTGTAPTNTQWLNTLNTAYGVESSIGTIEQCISNGLLTETAEGLIDTGLSAAIEAAPEYTSLGLDQMFTTIATDTGVSAASGAVNLANTAVHVGKFGTIGAFAGAVAVGVGAGVLANKVYNYVSAYVKYGFPMSKEVRDTIINNIPAGYDKVCYGIYRNSNTTYFSSFYFLPKNVICVSYETNDGYGGYKSIGGLKNADSFTWNQILYRNNRMLQNTVMTWTQSNLQSSGLGPSQSGSSNTFVDRKTDAHFDTEQEARDYIASWKAGNVELREPVAPDIITPSGNASMIEGPDGNDIINGQGNIVPEGYDMSPVDVQDYLNFADQANDNYQNGDTGQDIQGEAFDDFVDPYLIPPQQEPDTPIIPDNPDIPTPEYPDRPVIPDQPTVPDKPDATPEDITDMTDMMTTPELKSVFPFCIPWDLYNLFHIFDTGENRRAPHIVFTFPGTDWHIDVDLVQFDPVAALLRLLELIAFIAGLAVATRALIGANG